MLKSIQQSLILGLCVGAPFFCGAATLSENEAKIVAAEFFQSGKVQRLNNKDAFTLAHISTDVTSNPVCYVFNAKDGKGFIIVSADDTSMPVIAYSTTSVWDNTSIPEATGSILSTPTAAAFSGVNKVSPIRAGELESRLLTTPSWGQEAPFNNNIPNRRLTGCVGVALAEILKYHAFPANRPATLVKDGETTTYSWGDMRNDNYRNGYTQDEADVVATLVADAAIAIGTDFGMSSSSAFEVKVPYALSSLFGYDSGVSYKKRSEMSKDAWDAVIVNEINEGRPVLYSGQDVSSGHAFVCDGYEKRGGTVYFHINWGWGGSANGYYASDALNPVVSRAHSYNDLTTIVYNIKPSTTEVEWSPIHITSDERQVGLTLDVTDVPVGKTFTVRAGALKNISNSDFSGKLSIALFDAAGKQKALLNDGRNYKLIALQTQKYVDFTCQLPSGISVTDGDVVRLVAKSSDDAPWLPVAGDLLAPGEAKAKDGEIPYFSVTIPPSSEDAEVTAADSKVIKGRDFSFNVTPKSADKVITVKANGFILTADASNNYKINNIVEDQNIDIIVQNASEVLSKCALWLEAGKLQELLDEKETATIVDLTLFGTMNVNDFTFIRERMKLNRLDISQVNILASGSNPANAIPAKAFSGYRSLQTIILPSNLTTFKSGCFNNTGLRSIEIPASVATYEYNIFVNCSSLREVIVRRSAPAWVNWCVFEGTPKAKLIVPVGASSAYKAKEYWQDFKEIEEQNAVAPDFYTVTVKEVKGLKFTPVTEGTQFAPGTAYSFKLESDNSFGDTNMEVYANSERLYLAADGTYNTKIKANTLIHVIFKEPLATTVDKTWKITGEAGGIGLVTEIVNVPVGKPFTVRANAIKVPAGADASKFYAMALTDKDGKIKEFISPVITNLSSSTGNITYNFSCQVNEATVREDNLLRLATSYNKKDWTLVDADADSIVDRISAIGNRVIYHNIAMPQSVTGAQITGAATQIVRGMPFNLKVTPVSPLQRVTLAVNGINKVVSAAVANLAIPAVTEDLEITIQINDAGASDYVVINVQEGELAQKIAECPARLKVVGTILESEFAAFRAKAAYIIDLDLSDLTIKGEAMSKNAIPSNAFAPVQSSTVSALKKIMLPQNLERISDNAFARCTQLTEVTIPASVTYVGMGAFSSCTALTKIIMQGQTPPATGSMSPFPTDTSKITLEVPRGAESAYAAASFWSTIGPKAAKSVYWIKYDPKRAFIYTSYYGDGSQIEVATSQVSVSVGLPNCPTWSKSTGIYRNGVIFRLYDNGREITTYSAPDQYGYGGQYNVQFNPNVSSVYYAYPQNHTLDVVFYYPVIFENLEGAADVKAEIVNIEGDDRYDAPMSKFVYGATGNRTAYREGKDYKFRLTASSPNVVLAVKIENKIMTKTATKDTEAEYETRIFDVIPDQEGLYTIPALPGDTWVRITGTLHVEEGEPIASTDLSAIEKDDVEDFTELAVTGLLDDEDFDAIREKFESLETLDLSEIENESIPSDAFAGMENLRSVVLSDHVVEIGSGSFKDCENLESITIPGVSVIGEGAFEGCTNLTSVILPASSTTSPEVISRSASVADGITAESFRGLNPNCVIYMADKVIPDADHLNIILNVNGHRVAASDIVLDGNHPFNAPASFSLGNHRISFTVDIPGSEGYDVNGGWKGIMLPFTPTGMTYGVEFANRANSGLSLISFDGEEAETMTRQTAIFANRPYMANVCAPYPVVPVTFFADGLSDDENFVYDVAFTPMPEETAAVGKDFTLYGSFDGETRLGEWFALNSGATSFILAADSLVVRPFDAYLCANPGVSKTELTIGDHSLWIHNPASAGVSGTKLYRKDKIELVTPTQSATIYYTVDGTDPSDSEGSRRIYSEPFTMESDTMIVNAIAEYKGNFSDCISLAFELKRVDLSYNLLQNWNWISHNMESAVAVSDFATEGISRIVAQTQESVRDPKHGLVGTLRQLLPATAYKVCVSGETWTGSIDGVAYDPTTTVTLHSGWNWIGCPVDDASLLITDLLAGIEAEEGDMIVGLEGYEQADADGVWKGTLSALRPGTGYLYFSNSDKEFTYNLAPVTEQPALVPAPKMTVGSWVVDNHRYPSVMPVTAALIDVDGSIADPSDYRVAAFCGDECRGVGIVVDGAVMLNIHGNLGDLISFRFISPDDKEMISSTTIRFDEMPVSSFNNPFGIGLDGTAASDAIKADTFEIVSIDGGITVKGDLSSIIAVEVYDIAGNKTAVATKAADGSLSFPDLESGVRIVLVRTDSTCIYRKVMVK